MKLDKKKETSISISLELRNRLDKYAEVFHMSRSALIQLLVLNSLDLVAIFLDRQIKELEKLKNAEIQAR